MSGRSLHHPGWDHRQALTWPDRALTYGELRREAARIADAVPGDGSPRPAVGVVCDGGPTFLSAFLGLVDAGWTVGVLDAAWSPDELDAAVRQLSPAAVLVPTGVGWHPRLPRADGPDGWRLHHAGDAAGPPAPPDGDAPFYVGFTSGSSGTPKAFVRSHRSWWESFERFTRAAPFPHDGVVMVPGPLSSSHFLFGALHGLHVGATLECGRGVMREAGPAAAAYVVPTMLASLCQTTPAGHGPGLLFCAGARLESAVRERTRSVLPRSTVVEYYGASELSFVTLRRDGDGTPPGSVGPAFPGVQIQVRDPQGRSLPAGSTGTVWVRSDLVFAGYRGGAPSSGARVDDDGWVTVDDRGRLDPDGHLHVDGRGSALIITGGANVQPEEVEEVVALAPGVAACAVVGVPHPRWGEVVCAAVTVAPGSEVTRSALRAVVNARLARHKRPRRYVRVAAIPLTPSGKVDRATVLGRLVDAGPEAEIR